MSDYMSKEEFEKAVIEIAEDICGNANGPIDLTEVDSLKTTPPQKFRDIDIKTRKDIVAHIGAMYASGNGAYWTPRMGRPFNYRLRAETNWPQYVDHPMLGELQVNRASEMTVRRLGCRVFYINGCGGLPAWLRDMLRFYKKKHDAIIASIPKKYTDEEIDTLLKWSEPSTELAREFGPTGDDYIELWRISTRKRIMAQLARLEQRQAEAIDALHQLSADIVAFLEKSPFKPKYGTETNCADVSICARPE